MIILTAIQVFMLLWFHISIVTMLLNLTVPPTIPLLARLLNESDRLLRRQLRLIQEQWQLQRDLQILHLLLGQERNSCRLAQYV